MATTATQFAIVDRPARKTRAAKEVTPGYLDAVRAALEQAKPKQAVVMPESFTTPGRASSHGARVRTALGDSHPVRVHVIPSGDEYKAGLSLKR